MQLFVLALQLFKRLIFVSKVQREEDESHSDRGEQECELCPECDKQGDSDRGIKLVLALAK